LACKKFLFAARHVAGERCIAGDTSTKMNSPLFEPARVFVRFDHVARVIANADHKRSGLLTRIATMESVLLCARTKS
jgi:hypothetical protein